MSIRTEMFIPAIIKIIAHTLDILSYDEFLLFNSIRKNKPNKVQRKF